MPGRSSLSSRQEGSAAANGRGRSSATSRASRGRCFPRRSRCSRLERTPSSSEWPCAALTARASRSISSREHTSTCRFTTTRPSAWSSMSSRPTQIERSTSSGRSSTRATSTRAASGSRPRELAPQFFLAEDSYVEEDRGAGKRGEDERRRLRDADGEQPEPDQDAEAESPEERNEPVIEARWSREMLHRRRILSPAEKLFAKSGLCVFAGLESLARGFYLRHAPSTDRK